MHVIHAVADLDPALGGTSRSISELAIALAREGITTFAWTPQPQQANWVEPLRSSGVRILNGSLQPLLSFNREDLLIHSHGIWLPTNHRVAKFATRYRLKRVVSPRGMLEPWALNHRRWKKRLAWKLYQQRDLQQAAALHATAPAEAEQLRKLGMTQPIFVVPNGIAPPEQQIRVASSRFDKNGVSQQATGKSRTAVFLSRIHPKKGLPLLAEAWQRVRPVGWQMQVVGPDEEGHRRELESLVEQLGIADVWRFHDPVFGEEKWRVLGDADLMILPTHSENFGNVVAESLMVGTPVITTTGTPWSDFVTHRCGWWVEPTVECIAAALREACGTRSDMLWEMGQRGRLWAERGFAWDGIAARMIAAYEAVLGAKTTLDFVSAA